MEVHPFLQLLFVCIVGSLAATAVVWFYAGYGVWMNDAFDSGRWVWFAFLLDSPFLRA